ncbi:MAG: hypothetical protein KatS3mg063_1548 [Tepidiforma sp.]|nr:MAG: hypothetical protein KatS3mg063_1548 [Tepidiforma sp.]
MARRAAVVDPATGRVVNAILLPDDGASVVLPGLEVVEDRWGASPGDTLDVERGELRRAEPPIEQVRPLPPELEQAQAMVAEAVQAWVDGRDDDARVIASSAVSGAPGVGGAEVGAAAAVTSYGACRSASLRLPADGPITGRFGDIYRDGAARGRTSGSTSVARSARRSTRRPTALVVQPAQRRARSASRSALAPRRRLAHALRPPQPGRRRRLASGCAPATGWGSPARPGS